MYGLIQGPFTDEYKRSQSTHQLCCEHNLSSTLSDTPEQFVYKIAKIMGACRHVVKRLDLVQGAA